MPYEKGKGLFYAIEALARLCRTLYLRQLQTEYCGKKFCWDPLSSFFNLYSRKTRYRQLFPHGNLQAGNWIKTTENKRIMPTQQGAISSVIFPSKVRFVFRSKTFPKNDVLCYYVLRCSRQQ